MSRESKETEMVMRQVSDDGELRVGEGGGAESMLKILYILVFALGALMVLIAIVALIWLWVENALSVQNRILIASFAVVGVLALGCSGSQLSGGGGGRNIVLSADGRSVVFIDLEARERGRCCKRQGAEKSKPTVPVPTSIEWDKKAEMRECETLVSNEDKENSENRRNRERSRLFAIRVGLMSRGIEDEGADREISDRRCSVYSPDQDGSRIVHSRHVGSRPAVSPFCEHPFLSFQRDRIVRSER